MIVHVTTQPESPAVEIAHLSFPQTSLNTGKRVNQLFFQLYTNWTRKCDKLFILYDVEVFAYLFYTVLLICCYDDSKEHINNGNYGFISVVKVPVNFCHCIS